MRSLALPCSAACLALALVSTLGACGSRGPLDADPLDAGAPDVAAADVTLAPEPPEDPPPVVDAGAEGGSILGCGICVVRECGEKIRECVLSPTCRETFQCVVTECFASGGGFQPACLLQCAAGDPKGALQMLSIFQCVTETCGDDCGPLLDGVLGGGGGGGGGFGGGGKEAAPIARAFSAWPELTSGLRVDESRRAEGLTDVPSFATRPACDPGVLP
jgi:predicted small lipoprotein YifL